MAYDETTYRRPDNQGDEPSAYRLNGMGTDYRGRRRDLEIDDGDSGSRYADAPANDPRRFADDGRDRLGIHIGWEIVLLVAVAALAYLLYRLDPASVRRP